MRVVWTIELALAGAALVIAAAVGALAANVDVRLVLALAPFVVFAAWWYPRAKYERWSYALEPLTLELRSGIYWRSEVSVPYFRVQNVDISQGPIERYLGLAELRMKTAASSGGASLPGVPFADADELRRTILDRASGVDAD